jgi:lambda family phage portal protein
MNLRQKISFLFNPTKFLKDKNNLKALSSFFRNQRSQLYGAAKTNQFTYSWQPTNQDPNTIIGASSEKVRARGRQLDRDFPYFYNARNQIVNYVVGDGIKFRSRVKSPDGRLDKMTIQKIQDSFSRWADKASTDGKQHFYELQALGKSDDVVAGESFFIKNFGDRSRYIPYTLQPIDADQLQNNYTVEANDRGNLVVNGVEFNKKTGAVDAYHFQENRYNHKVVRMPAENVIHIFKMDRPGQVRGISQLVSAIQTAHLLKSYLDSEQGSVAMASRWLGFVTKDDPSGFQSAFSEAGTGDDAENRFMDIEDATIEFLNENEKIQFADPQRPSGNFKEYVRLILRMLAVTSGAPYELISGDYEGLNYTVLRGTRNDFYDRLRPVIARHIRQFCWPAIKPFFSTGVMSGRLDLPGFMSDPWIYQEAEWLPPGMSPVDPLKEGKADISLINQNLMSPFEAASRRGRDLDRIYEEIQLGDEMKNEFGIGSGTEVSTANANAPSAVEDQK